MVQIQANTSIHCAKNMSLYHIDSTNNLCLLLFISTCRTISISVDVY